MIIIPWNDEQYKVYTMAVLNDMFSKYIEADEKSGCTLYMPEDIAQVLKCELGHFIENTDKDNESHKIAVEMYKQLAEELKASWYY